MLSFWKAIEKDIPDAFSAFVEPGLDLEALDLLRARHRKRLISDGYHRDLLIRLKLLIDFADDLLDALLHPCLV